jgi:hypothetical protein
MLHYAMLRSARVCCAVLCYAACNTALGWGTCDVLRCAALLTHDHDNLGQVLCLLQAPASEKVAV